MFESILVPLDGSQSAEAALAPAEEIALREGSDLHLLHAITPIDQLIQLVLPFASVSSQSNELREHLLNQQLEHESVARVYVNGLRERLAAKGIRAVAHVHTGEVTDEILRYTHDAKITAIIMTSYGRGARESRLYGSIAGEVVRRSPVPVLLLHPGKTSSRRRS